MQGHFAQDCRFHAQQDHVMVQFLWQDDLVNVSKLICDCMDVMLRADSDDQSQTSDQP